MSFVIIFNLLQEHCVKSVRIRSYSGLHFSTFGLNTERYFEQSECRKMRTRITRNTGTFHGVEIIKKFLDLILSCHAGRCSVDLNFDQTIIIIIIIIIILLMICFNLAYDK